MINKFHLFTLDLTAADELHLHSQEANTATIETVVFPVIGVLLMSIFASLLLSNPCWGNNKSHGGPPKPNQKGQRLRFHDVTEEMLQPAIAPVLQQENNEVVDAVKKEYNDLPQHQPVSSLVAGISGLSCQTCAVNFVVSPEVADRGVKPAISPEITKQTDQENQLKHCGTLCGTENVPGINKSNRESQMLGEQSFCHSPKLSQQPREKIQNSSISTDMDAKEIVESKDTRALTTPSRNASHLQLSYEIDSLGYESCTSNSCSLLLRSRTVSPVAPACEPAENDTTSQRILGLQNTFEMKNILTLSSRNLAVQKWLKDIEEIQSKHPWREDCIADQISSAESQAHNISLRTRRRPHVLHRKEKLTKTQRRHSLDATSESDTNRLGAKLKAVDKNCSYGLKCQSRCKKIVKKRVKNVRTLSTDNSLNDEREEKDTSQSCCEIKNTPKTVKHGRSFSKCRSARNTNYDPLVDRKTEKTNFVQTCTNASNCISSNTRGASVLGEPGVVGASDVLENVRGASILAESQIDINNTRDQSSVQWKTVQTSIGSQNNEAKELRDEISSAQRNGQETENFKIPGASFFANNKTLKSGSAFDIRGGSFLGHQTTATASNVSGDDQTNNWNNTGVRDDTLGIDISSVSLSMAFDSGSSRHEKSNKFKSKVSMLQQRRRASLTRDFKCCKQYKDESSMFEEMPNLSSTPIPRERTNVRKLTSSPGHNENLQANCFATQLNKNSSNFSERRKRDYCSTRTGNETVDGFQIKNKMSKENEEETPQFLENAKCINKVNIRSCEGAEIVLLPNNNKISSGYCENKIERKLNSSPIEKSQFEKQERSNYEDVLCSNSQKIIESDSKENAQRKNYQTIENPDYNDGTERCLRTCNNSKKMSKTDSDEDAQDLENTSKTIKNHKSSPQLDFARVVPSSNSKNAQEKNWKTREICDENIVIQESFSGPSQPSNVVPAHNSISNKIEMASDEKQSGNCNNTKQGVKSGVNSSFMQGLLNTLKKESSSKKLKKDTFRINDEQSVRKPLKDSCLNEHTRSINTIREELRGESKLGRVNSIVKNEPLREKMDDSDFRENHKVRKEDQANELVNKKCWFGKLSFSLIYNSLDESHSLLYVSIHQLKDLALRSIGCQQGVQIKFCILPKASMWKYSKIIKGEDTTLQFKDVFIVSGISPEGLIDSVIKFVVLSDNFPIGELVVPLAELYYRKKMKRTSDLTQPETNANKENEKLH